MAKQVHHNTDDEVRSYLSKALDLVDALDVPSDLREKALDHAVALYAAKQVFVEPHDVQTIPVVGRILN